MERPLTQMLRQYQLAHEAMPEKIVVAPAAAVVLTLRRSLAPVWQGVPVVCKMFNPEEAVMIGQGKRLGVFVKRNGWDFQLRAVELR